MIFDRCSSLIIIIFNSKLMLLDKKKKYSSIEIEKNTLTIFPKYLEFLVN